MCGRRWLVVTAASKAFFLSKLSGKCLVPANLQSLSHLAQAGGVLLTTTVHPSDEDRDWTLVSRTVHRLTDPATGFSTSLKSRFESPGQGTCRRQIGFFALQGLTRAGAA